MQVHQLINLLQMLNPNAEVHIKVIGKWDFIDNQVEPSDIEARNFLPSIEFYGSEVRCDISNPNEVIIYSELKDIIKDDSKH